MIALTAMVLASWLALIACIAVMYIALHELTNLSEKVIDLWIKYQSAKIRLERQQWQDR